MRDESKDVYQLALMEIDREATRSRIEQELETARIYTQVGCVRREIQSTPSYMPRFHGNTNAISKQVEDVAIWNASNSDRLKEAYERVQTGLSRLKKLEREIIQMRYLDDEDVLDYNVYSELSLSERSYYRRKSRALYKLAFAMNLEVYVGDSE